MRSEQIDLIPVNHTVEKSLDDFDFARLREIERLERRIGLIERWKRPLGATVEVLALACWYVWVRYRFGAPVWAIIPLLVLLIGVARRVGSPLVFLALDLAAQDLRTRQSKLREEHRRLVRGYPPRTPRT